MKLYLIRHPKPDIKQGLCYGQADVPLLDGWQAQARLLRRYLDTLQGSVAFYHSPISRAAELAGLVSQNTSQPQNALKELDFGLWENLLWEDIPKESIDLWFEDIVDTAPYQGESLQVLADRVWCWWSSIKRCNTEHLVVVTHSGVIKVLVSLLCQWPLAQSHRIDVGFMSVTELFIQDEYISLKRLGAGDWVI